ncbi:MAG: Na+/H+ antiporter NhaC family protein [Oscillospiraceae bacterium]
MRPHHLREVHGCDPQWLHQMISPILILCFAWTLCVCRDNGLQVGAFVEGVMANTGSLAKVPAAVIFIVACFIGFATGTSWVPSASWSRWSAPCLTGIPR